MSSLVNEFILYRINTLNPQHLPPKLVQVVCCKLTDIQQNIYQHMVFSKDMQFGLGLVLGLGFGLGIELESGLWLGLGFRLRIML